MTYIKLLVAMGVLAGMILLQGCGKRGENDIPSSKNDYYLSLTNTDNLEVKVRQENVGDAEFCIEYVITNNGRTPVYRVVPTGPPHYHILIRPFDVAVGERKNGTQITYSVPHPDSLRFKDVMVLFGTEQVPDNIMIEAIDAPIFQELKPGESEKGKVFLRLPIRKKSFYGLFAEETKFHSRLRENAIDRMISTEAGAPCVLAFAYLLPEDCLFEDNGEVSFGSEEKSRLAFSKEMALSTQQQEH